ncbi:MAG: hypothetical protein ACO1O6_06210 [Bacteroidota bacterium]
MRFVLIFLCCMLCFPGKAQEEFSHFTCFLEAGGAGGYGSVNGEIRFLMKDRFTFTARLGLGTYKLTDFERRLNPDIILPVTFLLAYGKKQQIELGAGPSFSSFPVLHQMEKQRDFLLSANFLLGYRYTTSKKFFYRVAFTPMYESNKQFRPWFGLSFGKGL